MIGKQISTKVQTVLKSLLFSHTMYKLRLLRKVKYVYLFAKQTAIEQGETTTQILFWFHTMPLSHCERFLSNQSVLQDN